jgi:hypothetical protein
LPRACLGDAELGSSAAAGDPCGDALASMSMTGPGMSWLVGSDGGVFAFGSARCYGSMELRAHPLIGRSSHG